MAGSQPGPTCPITNPVAVDLGTLCVHGTPRAAGICGTPVPACFVPRPITIDTFICDEDRLTSFFRSVAHAKAMERHMKVAWTPYTESRVLNFIYDVMPWKGQPGTVEVDFGKPTIIDDETRKDTDQLWNAFLDKAATGGKRAGAFLKAQEDIRASCLKTVADTLHDAQTINQDIIRETQRGIFKLAVIKAASTLVVKTLSTFAKNKAMFMPNNFLGKMFLTPQFLIGTAYDLSLAYIDDPSDGERAKLVAVEQKSIDKVEKKVGTTALKNIGETFQPSATSAHQANWLPKRLAEMQERLEREADAELYKKFARDSRRLARAQQDIARNARISSALSNVKFVFLAVDWWKTVARLGKTIDEAGGTGYDFMDRRLGY